MGYQDFTDGNALAASQLDEMSKQGVLVYASVVARDADAALTAALRHGMVCYVTGTNRFYTYNGVAWVITGWISAGGRVGGSWRRGTSQVVADATDTYINWDAEDADVDGIFTPTTDTLTLPTAGLYDITANLNFSSGAGGWAGYIGVYLTGGTFSPYLLPASVNANALAMHISLSSLPVVAGGTVKVRCRHASGVSQNVSGILHIYQTAR